ncbi:MAG: hypothetical protein DCC55_08930 [Chloroflexi bacterium]|nr:MAG: hypothetical protein DCC55_08930 [Chloroflexota bacterium]
MIRVLVKQSIGLISGAAVALAVVLAGPNAAARWLDAPAETGASAVMASAPVAPVLHYQGRLLDPTTGQPKPDGSYPASFRIYNVATGGSPLWTETKSIVISRGLFSTLLGDTTALDLSHFDGRELYLGVSVGSDPEAEPRQRIAFVAYALYAADADTLDGQDAAAFAPASHPHDGSAVTSGTIAEARIDPAIARDGEIVPAVLAADGAGSGLDADLLDGQNADAFATAGHRHSSLDAPDGNPQNALQVNNAGDVGIGTTTPSAKLDVVGTIEARGYAGSSTITTFSVPADLEIVMEPTDNPSIASAFDVFKTSGSPIFSLSEAGNLFVRGNFMASGSKNAVVSTSDGERLLYAEEAAEVWFTDYGFGRLNQGVALIPVEPIFAQTVNLSQPYHVFVQAYGNAELYVANRTPTGFEVRLREGDPNAEFSYRIAAKRLGYEAQRLQLTTPPTEMGQPEQSTQAE